MRKLVIGLLLLCAATAYSAVYINEVQSANDATCTDEIGNSSDWIELYNDSGEVVDISGWGLSDNAAKPYKWTFPDGTTMSPGEYLRVFADGLTPSAGAQVEALSPTHESVNSDLVCWFDADQALASYGESGRVELWKDQGPFGNNATNTVVAQQPVVVADAVNGHAALSFSSSVRQQLFLPRLNFEGMSSFSNATVIIVGSWDGTVPSTTKRSGLLGLSLTTTTTDAYFEIQSGGALRIRNGLAANDLKVSAGIKPDSWYGFSFMTDSNREAPLTELYLNKGLLGKISGPVGAQDFAAYDGSLVIGNTYRTLPGYNQNCAFNGKIAEILIFRRALEQSEFQGVYKYLQNKYNLADTANLHAGFSLSSGGETIVLTDVKTGTVSDQMTFGSIPCDTSFGRSSKNSDRYVYFSEPTPNALNAVDEYDAPLVGVEFSVSRGVYEEPLALELSHPDADAEIYYTVDRSEPTSENGIRYTPGEVIHIDRTTTVRATAIKDGALPYRNIVTHSYIFLDDIVSQRKPDIAPNDWSDVGSCKASYELSSNVLTDSDSIEAFKHSLMCAPMLSISMPTSDLFDPANGIYCNPSKLNGSERAASVEWVTGDQVLGLDAGVRVQGNMSRRFDKTPKKSFRIAFRSRYGENSLDAPVLSTSGCDKTGFKTLVLRAEHNYSWPASENGASGTYMQDQFVRDLQGRVSGYQTNGSQVHLFINGLYWGVYNITERPDDTTSTAIWGGEKDDWDVIKNTSTSFEVRDGDAVSFKELLAYSQLDLSDPDNYLKMTERLSVKDFVDYMMIETFIANMDWPNNNWVCMGNPISGEPFRYAVWDSEIAMFDANSNRLNLKPSGGSPYMLHSRLMQSDEYRLMFADRARKHLLDGGALTADETIKMYNAIAERVRPTLFAESVRWGAYKHDYVNEDTPIYGLSHWDNRRKGVENFLTARPGKYLAQLKAVGLYPSVEAPMIICKDEEGKVAALSMIEGANIYYTIDGSDPREAFTGAISSAAQVYEDGAEIKLDATGLVRARALSTSGEWSALSEVELEGTEPTIVKNEFLPTGNGENWDKDVNWSEGVFPNEAGAWAVIGVPTAFKKDKGWRNIHINKTDVTVGHIEMTCGGCTNRVDTGKSGNLIFSGKLDAEGVPLEDATFVAMDEANPSLAMIDLDAPNKVILATDLEVVVSNTVGDVEYGGALFKGLWEGNGHNLAKSGSGLMTLDVSNTPETAFAKIQVAEGSIAITKKVYAEAITKEGICMAALGSTDLAEAVAKASELSDKVSVNDVRLFVPSYVGGSKYYGAFVAKNSLTTTNAKKGKYVSAYVRDMAGDVRFDGKAYRLIPDATIKTMTLEDGRMTYVVDVPEQDVSVYVGPDGKEVPADESTTTEDLIGKVRDRSKIVIKGSSEIVVDNSAHTISVDGVTYVIPDYYDAKVVGKWVQIAFNENARPEYASPIDGSSDILVIGESDVSLGVKTKAGLKYTLQQRASLVDGEWSDVKTVVGNGAIQRLEGERLPNGGFYRIVVSD